MKLLRVCSMWQPWATLCVAPLASTGRPAKHHETRGFAPRPPLPIDVAIHATKKWDNHNAWTSTDSDFERALRFSGFLSGSPRGRLGIRTDPSLKPLPFGAIIGVASIVRVDPTQALFDESFGRRSISTYDYLFGDWTRGRFAWEFANTFLLPEPISFKGRQDVLYLLDPAVQAEIDRQLAESTTWHIKVADAWNKGEDKYRAEVLGQFPLLERGQ